MGNRIKHVCCVIELNFHCTEEVLVASLF